MYTPQYSSEKNGDSKRKGGGLIAQGKETTLHLQSHPNHHGNAKQVKAALFKWTVEALAQILPLLSPRLNLILATHNHRLCSRSKVP